MALTPIEASRFNTCITLYLIVDPHLCIYNYLSQRYTASFKAVRMAASPKRVLITGAAGADVRVSWH